MSDERLIDLEIRFSHQDDFIQQLNAVVIEQQKRIDSLEKAVLDLKRNINVNDPVNSVEKPPHY
jgi:SlyX protein